MTNTCSWKASTWSSAISAAIRRLASRAASSPRRCRCMWPRLQSGIRPPRRQIASASRCWRMARRCGVSLRTERCSTPEASKAKPMVRLEQFYRDTVVPKLKADLQLANVMQVPKITKITVNMGVGEAVADRKVMDAAVGDMTKITGQKPLICKSRKSIASFKLREGLAIGCKVTLRGERMYEFLDRLISIAMPRIRDFRGVSPRAFDGRGNYTLGVKEQIIFPEIQYDQ